MPFARINLRPFVWSAVAGLMLGFTPEIRAAGVTLITHGYNGNTSGWITGMANAMSARLGGNVPIYRINVTSGGGGLAAAITNISGINPVASTNCELILMLDWGPVSGGGTTTYDVAGAVAPLFGQTNLVPQLAGHALAEFPIHLIGHSRGGSLVCELSRKLGELGLWVDQVTALDAYPLGGDAPVATYENVLFADSYYQTDGLLSGGPVPGSFWRRQTVASGGYSFPFDWHSDVHLWYHGTIDLSPTASDTEAGFTSTMRTQWWTAAEQKGTNAGFNYSRLGGGDRLGTVQPNGVNSSTIRAGLNQKYDFGAGATNNRTALGVNAGEWPNVIRLGVLTSNPVAHGASAQFQIDFQWAVSGSLTQSVQVFLDADRNPLNGNERLILTDAAAGTTSSQIGTRTITVPLDATNAPAGNYAVFAKLTGGGRSRLLYAPSVLRVIASTAPPLLDITSVAEGGVVVGVNGVVGQTLILQQTTDLNSWQPIVTNVLGASRWEVTQSNTGTNVCYRAAVLP